MARRILFLLIVYNFLLPVSYAQDSVNDSRLRDIVEQYGQAEVTVVYSGRMEIDNLSREFSISTVRNKLVHIILSPLTLEKFILRNLDYSIVEREKGKGIVSAGDIDQAMEWDVYPTYSQYDSIMLNFTTLYPLLCKLDTIGTSVNGRLVLALKISDNAGDDENEPEVFYTSTIHGDELAGYVLMLRFADYLLKNYGTSSRVNDIVDNLEIWINPLANPDGTYTSGNTITNPTRANANGVDLNRNFPDPFQPFEIQQQENIDMINFMREHKFILSANFHSGSELFNYPWDRWLSKIHADDSWFNSIGRAYADTVHAYSVSAYMDGYDNGVVRGAVWYIIYGGRQDFVTWELQGREVTVELDITKETPAEQLALLWEYNRRSFLTYLENALYGIHGLVRNVSSLEPVAAKVLIAGHDKDSSHVYSDTLTGSFVRLISPGSWNLTFSADGYIDTTISNITVFDGQRTDIIVDMVPELSNIDTAIPEPPVIYPNPAKTELNVILPEGINGAVNVMIFNQLGKPNIDYNTEVIRGVPLIIDVKGLSSGTYSVIIRKTSNGAFSRGKVMVIK